jgi:iron complex transport system ATP-binding protein
VLHDLNLAARYADHLIAMRDGRIVAEGPPAAVVTQETVSGVFDLECRVVEDPVSGTPMVVPIGRYHGPSPVRTRTSPAGEQVRGYRPNPQDTVPAHVEAAS